MRSSVRVLTTHNTKLLIYRGPNKVLSRLRGMTTEARFKLYVKAGKDGNSLGDCPFSQRANMFARMKLNSSDFELVYVDTANKPDYLLKLNSEGKVPVLVDNKENKVIADSADITKYIGELQADGNAVQDTEVLSKATEACSGVFPKFAGMMKNKDASKDEELKNALTSELKKLNDFLDQNKNCGRFLTDDKLREVDCQILPKLKHVQVAGKKWKEYEIPAELTALFEYIKHGEDTEIFKASCPGDEQFIWGWSMHM